MTPAAAGPLASVPLGEVLNRVAARTPAPGGGAVAAAAVGLASALCAMAARYSTATMPDAEELAVRSEAVAAQALALADADADAYGALLAVRRAPDRRPDDVDRALLAATDVPLEVAEVGAAVASTARRLADQGNPHLRGDAETAGHLAAGAVTAALRLVELNLAELPAGDEGRAQRARNALASVRAAAVGTDGGGSGGGG